MPIEEYEYIVEYSYNPRQDKFVVRFLDGRSYSILVTDLPKKMQSKKPAWGEASLAVDKSSLSVIAGDEVREIPAYLIHSKGKEL